MSCEASALPAAAVLCRRAASICIFLAVLSNSGHFCQISGFAFDLSVSEPSGKSEGIMAAFFEMMSAFAATTAQFPVFAFSWMLFQASPFCFITFCRSSTTSAGDFGWAVVNTATSKMVTATRAPRLIDGRIVPFLSRGGRPKRPCWRHCPCCLVLFPIVSSGRPGAPDARPAALTHELWPRFPLVGFPQPRHPHVRGEPTSTGMHVAGPSASESDTLPRGNGSHRTCTVRSRDRRHRGDACLKRQRLLDILRSAATP